MILLERRTLSLKFLCHDVIYFKGNFYSSLHSGEIVLFEDLHEAVKFARRPRFHGGHTSYLFDIGGNLCMTCGKPFDVKDDEDGMRCRMKFVFFKLDMDTKSWEKIYSLGDRSLFIGNCCTFTVAAADFPGCKPNCIYSTAGPIGNL